MYKYIVLCLSVCLCAILCDLNKEEGAACEWEDVKGTCVKKSRCLSILDEGEPKNPVCSEQGEETVVCCTDCEFVNNTRDAVVTPTGGLFWKNGNKARDYCLQYIQELPYRCKQNGDQVRIMMYYDEEKKCHKIETEAVRGSPPETPGPKYPHQAMLGFMSNDSQTAKWLAGGSIISDHYVLTSGWAGIPFDDPTFVAVNVPSRKYSPTWQIHKVKRYIFHPEYNLTEHLNDIALVETETPIKFDKNVLPACLHVEDVSIDQTVAITWRNVKTDNFEETLQEILLQKDTDEECHTKLPYNFYNSTMHMCYHNKTTPVAVCESYEGEPMLVNNQFSSCVDTVVGITLFDAVHQCNDTNGLVAYTKVSQFVPWIESIVWP